MGYSSDLKDSDWDLIKDHFSTGRYGNRAIHSRRSLVNGILYVVKRGVSGACCRLIFPHGKRFMAIFGASQSLEFRKMCWVIW